MTIRRRLAATLAGVLVALAALPAAADTCWDMRTTPRQLGASESIRVGTVSGPWAQVMQLKGRPATCAAGYYLEWRSAPSAPGGWADPIVGTDAAGVCAAVVAPRPAPPPPTPAEALAAALAELGERIDAAGREYVGDRWGDLAERQRRTDRLVELHAAELVHLRDPQGAPAPSAADLAEAAELAAQSAARRLAERYWWVPASPESWSVPADPAAESLYGCVLATRTTAAEVEAVDVAAPPADCPQPPPGEGE